MVDFNNETTVAQGSNEIVKITRIEKRYNLFEALEAYYKAEFQGQDTAPELSVIRARALNLFFEMEGELTRKAESDAKNRKKNDEPLIIEDLKDTLKEGEEEELMKAISFLNLFLDNIGLTKIDVRNRFDSTRVEAENKERKI